MSTAPGLTTPGLAVTEHRPATTPDSPDAVVVLVHGSLDRSDSFNRVVRRLADLHVVTYDRRGYQQSRHALPIATTVDAHVDDLVKVVAGRPAVVVGHSYGGTIALAAAIRHGAHPDADFPLLGIGAFEPPLPWVTQSLGTHPLSASLPGEDPAEAVREFFSRLMGEGTWDRLTPEARAERQADGPALVAEALALRTDPPPFEVTAAAVPAVFGRGSGSSPRAREVVGWLAGHWPSSELMEIEGARHGAHLSHPDAFAAFVRAAVAHADEHQPTGGRDAAAGTLAASS